MVNQVTVHLKRGNPDVCRVKDRKHRKSRTKTSTDDYKQTKVLKIKFTKQSITIKFK